MYDTIIFDLDGTLLNSLQDLCNSTNYVLNKYGFKERTLEEVRTFVGRGARVLIEKAIPTEVSVELFEQMLNEFKLHYREHSNDLTAPYPGIIDMLAAVKNMGFKTAILSNKPHNAVADLHKLYFESYIDVAMGVKEGIPTKPEPIMVNNVLLELKSDVKNTLYVGDSEVDVFTARNAGLDMITCLWGFRNKDELLNAGAEIFITKPQELLSWLKGRSPV